MENLPWSSKLSALASQITVKSVINPVLWLCVPSIFLFLIAAYTNGFLRYLLAAFGAIPWILVPIGFIYFMLKKPEFLRSEEYQLMAHIASLEGNKDNPQSVEATEVTAVNIKNP